jgi:hypothetical protein
VWKGANSIEKVRRCTVNFMGASVSPWKNKITKQKPGKWAISSFGCGRRDAGDGLPRMVGVCTRMRPAEDSLCAPGGVTCRCEHVQRLIPLSSDQLGSAWWMRSVRACVRAWGDQHGIREIAYYFPARHGEIAHRSSVQLTTRVAQSVIVSGASATVSHMTRIGAT